MTDRWKTIFNCFIVSVIVVFFATRPLNSPWHPFIAGDGLGYYSHLPATFIYHDLDYKYEWFNAVHNDNYVYSAFDDPGRNLLVDYGGRKINKFYPGLAVLWTPFFLTAHVVAKVTGYKADGFSLPYQLAIAVASLLYALLGLVYLRKLLLRLFKNDMAACIVPVCFFYGTYLFTYVIDANSLSHGYSFTVVVLFIHAVVKFRDEPECRFTTLLQAVFWFVVMVAIRPLDGLVLLAVPAFIKREHLVAFKWRKFSKANLMMVLLIVVIVFFICFINYRQTGNLLTYTYTNEKFDFKHAKFFEALISYHFGMFLYIPLIFISLSGAFYTESRKRWILMMLFFTMIFLYSAWWYWPVTKRAMIDFYVIPAILLGALLSGMRRGVRLLPVLGLCIIYFQFKAMQIRRGILDEYATYSELYWRNFFRTDKAQIYPVPPSTIIRSESHEEALEGATLKDEQGRRALSLAPGNYIQPVQELRFPALFNGDGSKKIRFSFHMFAGEGVSAVHVFFHFLNNRDSLIKEVPFYINNDFVRVNKWDYKEFGFEILPEDSISAANAARIRFILWNVEPKVPVYINAPRVEFILADRSLETVKPE
jgi:hypothetical protein